MLISIYSHAKCHMTALNVVALQFSVIQDTLRAQKAESAVANIPTCFVTYSALTFKH